MFRILIVSVSVLSSVLSIEAPERAESLRRRLRQSVAQSLEGYTPSIESEWSDGSVAAGGKDGLASTSPLQLVPDQTADGDVLSHSKYPTAGYHASQYCRTVSDCEASIVKCIKDRDSAASHKENELDRCIDLEWYLARLLFEPYRMDDKLTELIPVDFTDIDDPRWDQFYDSALFQNLRTP